MATSASLLNQSRLSPHNNEESFKYKLNCQSKIDTDVDNPETKEWLQLQSKIKHMSSDYKLFRGLLDKTKSIVVKIGSDKLVYEYSIGEILDKLNLPTFLSFNCMFSCNDDFKSLDSKSINNNTANRKYLCKKDGDKLVILVMPNVKLGAIYTYEWQTNNFKILQNILKHIVMSMLYSRYTLGFVHGDLHKDNVLLKKTTRKTLLYGELGSLDVLGYIPIIMDYDKSFIKSTMEINDKDVYDDVFRIIIGLCQDTNTVFDTANIITLIQNYSKTKTIISKEICEALCNEIDKFTIRYIKSEVELKFKELFNKSKH